MMKRNIQYHFFDFYHGLNFLIFFCFSTQLLYFFRVNVVVFFIFSQHKVSLKVIKIEGENHDENC